MVNVRRLKTKAIPWLFLLPCLVIVFSIGIYPFYVMWDISLHHFDTSTPKTMGQRAYFENYRTMLHNPDFWDSLGRTFQIMIPSVIVEMLLGLAIAQLVSSKVPDKYRKILVPLLIIPMTLAPICVGLVWRYILHGDFGVVTYFLNSMGLFLEESMLGSRSWAWVAVTIVDIWEWTPFTFLIFLSGLLALPKDTYEAAEIEGATAWMKFRYLTLRYLKPLIGIALILRFMDGIKLFDTIYILTGGGPAASTETLIYYTYRVSYIWWNLGYGAALSLFLFFIIIIACEFFYNITARRE